MTRRWPARWSGEPTGRRPSDGLLRSEGTPLSAGRTALVTLVVGRRHQALWDGIAAPSWRRYAARYGYDVIAIREPLDTSPRAAARSPAWQKCLVLGTAMAAQYDRIVWVDADIVINPEAPMITEGVALRRVGAVDEYASPDPATLRWALPQLYTAWRRAGRPFLDNPTPREYYATRGLPPVHDQVVQTGVLVLSPAWHREILEATYTRYEDPGGPGWGEMGPLSHELLAKEAVHWLDPRFNAPFAVLRESLRADASAGHDARSAQRVAETALERSFFLHFGGRHTDMLLLGPWIRRVRR